MAGKQALKPTKYPRGIPVQAPSGWRPPLPPPAPRRAAPPPFRAQVGLILRTMLLSLLVIACMGVGWFLVTGRRPSRAAGSQLAAATPKKDENKADAEPAVVPKEKEPPPAKEKAKGKEKEGPREKADKGKEKGPPMPPAKADEPAGNGLTYEKDVRPILERSCVSCHGAKKRGGLDARTYPALVKGGDGGTAVVPGDPDKSPLYETVASGQMPPTKKLPAQERETIRAWIAAGAKGGQ
jgi:hypothetical protein